MKSSSLRHYFLLPALILSLGSQSLIAGGGLGSTRYGIGELHYFPSSRAYGMGGASFAALSPSSINRMNPAAWTQLGRTRYSVGALYEGISSEDRNESRFFSGVAFSGLMVTLPVAPSSGVTLAFGISPYSRINYDVIVPSGYDTLNYNIQYLGTGGISLATVGGSVRLGTEFNLGLKIDYYSGTLNYTTRQLFAGSNYLNGEVTRTTEASGFGATAGFIYTGLKSDLNIPDGHSFSVGGLFSTGSSLDARERRYYAFDASNLALKDTSEPISGKLKIPYSLGGGLAYSTERLLYAADLHYQNWDNYSYMGNPDQALRNSFRFSAGLELMPKREASLPYFQRAAYRAGLYYNSSYYRFKGEPLDEIGISLGLGAPVFGDSRLDLSLGYSFRGTTDIGLQKDNLFRISFTLSGGETWFERPTQE